MIYRLRKKFIGICILSFIAVFLIAFTLIYVTTAFQINQTLDRNADMIYQNNGRFPDFNETKPGASKPRPSDGFNKESPFTTRYFTVRYGGDGTLLAADVQHIAGVNEAQAAIYAEKAISAGAERGWLDDYRYNVYRAGDGISIVFVSGANAKQSNQSFMLGTLAVFGLCSLVVIFLIVFISKKAVRLTAESYEKQKQFITNANHELKTPLTLIRTNLDILESEVGESEWIDDIRDESLLMSELVNRMVMLARMDEEGTKLEMKEFDISDAVADTVSAFMPAARSGGKELTVSICEHARYSGDEASIRQVVSILMDNALKYCDGGGEIKLTLTCERRPVLTVENSYAAVGNVEIERLFDRFYRADKARTWGTGFGIGLSIAKAIVEKHRGNISAYNIDNEKIGFKVKL